jgi:hypothetical protein
LVAEDSPYCRNASEENAVSDKGAEAFRQLPADIWKMQIRLSLLISLTTKGELRIQQNFEQAKSTSE